MSVLHVPAVPGRAGRAAAVDQAAARSPARASAAADKETAAEEAGLGTVAAGWAAVDRIRAAAAGSVAGGKCGAPRYLPTLGAHPPPVLAVPDAVAVDAVAEAVDAAAEAVDLGAADALPDLVVPDTRGRVRVGAH